MITNMKYLLTLSLASILLLGAGCSNTEVVEAPDDGMTPAIASVPIYVGAWERQGTYVNGVLEGEYPATLEMQEETYYSHNDICENSGTLEVVDDSVTMSITDTDCPVVPGYETIVYTHSFNVDGTEMTLVTTVEGVEVKEIYARKTY